MIRVSCVAAIEVHKALGADSTETAIEAVKKRMRAAALQVALDMRRDGYIVDLNVSYLVAYGGGEWPSRE